MDVISLHKYGYPALASLGTALTDEQIDKIFNLTDEAYLVFDGDVAGKNATLKVYEKYLPKLKFNKKLKFVYLPDNLDPEEFINRNGVNEFEKQLDKAVSILDMIWLQGIKIIRENEPETKALFWSYLRNKVNQIEDINIKLAYKDEIEKRIKIFRDKTRGYSKIKFSKRSGQQYTVQNKILPKIGVEIKIGAIIYMMLEYPKLCSKFDEKLSLLTFENKELNDLKEAILLHASKQSVIKAQNLQDILINEGFAILIKKVLNNNYSSRLNLNNDYDNLSDVFEELLGLVTSKKL